MSGVSRFRPALRSSASRAYDACAQVSGLAEPAGWPSTKPIEAVAGSVPNGDAPRLRVLPHLLGLEALTRGHLAHRRQKRRGSAAVAVRDVVFATLAGQHRPQVAGPRVGWRPRSARRACSSSRSAGSSRRSRPRSRPNWSRSGRSPVRWGVHLDRVVDRRSARPERPGRSPGARRAGPARGSPASTSERWSTVPLPLPRL